MNAIPVGQAEKSDLYFRRSLCQFIIRYLSGVDDPRRDEAMNEYKKQLAEIDHKITELTGTPPPVVVGLKTATLSGKSGLV